VKDKDLVIKVEATVGANVSEDGYLFKNVETEGKIYRGESKLKNISRSQATLLNAFLFKTIIDKAVKDFNLTRREDIESFYQDSIGKLHELNILRKQELNDEDFEK